NTRGRALEHLGPARADRHVRALRGQPLGRGSAESFAAPRDDGDFAFQSKIEHRNLLLVGWTQASRPSPGTGGRRSGPRRARRAALSYTFCFAWWGVRAGAILIASSSSRGNHDIAPERRHLPQPPPHDAPGAVDPARHP